MLRKLLATSAMATLLATGAIAQETTAPAATAPATETAPMTGSQPMATEPATAPAGATAAAFDYITALSANQHLSDDMVGADVMMQGAADQQAGEIQNLIVSADGTVLAAVLRTGDALGDESRDVAVPFDKFDWSMGENNEPVATLTATVDEISAAPTFTAEENTAAATGGTGTMAPAGGTAMAPAPAPAPAPAGETAGTMAATPAPATDGTPPVTTADGVMGGDYLAVLAADQYLADDLVGDSVYTGPTSESDNIGNINNLVINDDGTIAGLIVGVGGFLGIGQKNVGVPFDAVALTNDAEGEQHASLVVTKDDLEAAPAFEGRDADVAATTPAATGTSPAGTTAAGGTMAAGTAAGTGMAAAPAAETGMAAAPAAGTTAATDATTTASTGGASRPADLTPVEGAELTADNLIGTTVYGPDDSSLGNIGDIALTPEGQVDAVIVDVGGFLGIGAKPVAVAMDNLQFMRDSGGSMYLTTDFTQEELEAAPEYNSDTYAGSRDSMRLESGAAAQ